MKRIFFLMMAVLFLASCAKEEKNTVVDWEGNEYKTRNYGGTWWMVENLRTTRTKDGQNIWVSSEEDIFSYTTPYCYFLNNNESGLKWKGCLYNWSAANQVCPEGWHLPTIEDYEALTRYMGGVDKYCHDSNPKAIAKAMASDNDWEYSDTPGAPGYGVSFGGFRTANNASGFNAPPVGAYTPLPYSRFWGYGVRAYYWLSDEYDGNYANAFIIYYDEPVLVRDTIDKPLGISVRCVKD
ncbi:MAG: fibrobacter succinogenes major paralogous domain-containing protein [Bacteroidales bacterium]|nr:fibrobacter succinogenes major paralogous domain-containing protein [Bacteroidales bacterium]